MAEVGIGVRERESAMRAGRRSTVDSLDTTRAFHHGLELFKKYSMARQSESLGKRGLLDEDEESTPSRGREDGVHGEEFGLLIICKSLFPPSALRGSVVDPVDVGCALKF
jgi:hypothetical protein